MVANKQKQGKQNQSLRREHLANERTYLAWMRTAITIMGLGVVMVHIHPFHPPLLSRLGNGWKLGLLFVVVGLLTVLLSGIHYLASRSDINEDTYEPADH